MYSMNHQKNASEDDQDVTYRMNSKKKWLEVVLVPDDRMNQIEAGTTREHRKQNTTLRNPVNIN